MTVFGHVIVFGHVLGHVIGHVIWKVQKGHVVDHMIVSQGHVLVSRGHMGKSLSLLFGCS